MQFAKYMSSTFPGLMLSPPLFYSWPVGIRFELGAIQEGKTYGEVAMMRACSLYEAVFRPQDVALVVSGTVFYTNQRDRIQTRRGKFRTTRSNVFQLSKRHSLGLHGPAGRQRLVTEQDGPLHEITTLRWTEISPRMIDYEFILDAKANADYRPRRPHTDDRVYFVNLSRNIIFHMYDDRGLDVLAPHRDALQEIYDQHKSWVLDYDRAQIERTFERGRSSG